MRLFSRKQNVVVVVATRSRMALEALEQASDEFPMERREALSTQGLYDHLPGAHLVIVDKGSLVESEAMSQDRLSQILEESDVVVADGPAFGQDPQAWLDQARAASGLSDALPPRTVTFTGFSGGVGKTTLSLSLAKTFRQKTGLPVVVAELSHGPSALLALVGDAGWSHLYEVATQDAVWPSWEGVTLAPMDWPTARMLSDDQVRDAWLEVQEGHVLTVFDAPASHPFWSTARDLTDLSLAVTDGRPDAIASAVHLAQNGSDCRVLLNRSGRASLLALEESPAGRLPDVGGSARNFPHRLGKNLMPVVYPGWK